MKRGRVIQAIEHALKRYHDGCPVVPETILREALKMLKQKSAAPANAVTGKHGTDGAA